MRGSVLSPATLALAALIMAGCGGTTTANRTTSPPLHRPPKPDPQQFLQVDAARHSVRLTMIAGDGASNNGFNFDDYGRGELLATVPRGWRVSVLCKNAASGPNSCAVVSGALASAPAFKGATTPHPASGLPSGQSASFTFTASRVGAYRIASVVPGHQQARMYVVLEVTGGGKPSISARSGP